MALTEDQINEVQRIIYEKLPCATNKTCKEVAALKKTLEKVDTRTWLILASVILGIVIQIARGL